MPLFLCFLFFLYFSLLFFLVFSRSLSVSFLKGVLGKINSFYMWRRKKSKTDILTSTDYKGKFSGFCIKDLKEKTFLKFWGKVLLRYLYLTSKSIYLPWFLSSTNACSVFRRCLVQNVEFWRGRFKWGYDINAGINLHFLSSLPFSSWCLMLSFRNGKLTSTLMWIMGHIALCCTLWSISEGDVQFLRQMIL